MPKPLSMPALAERLRNARAAFGSNPSHETALRLQRAQRSHKQARDALVKVVRYEA